MDYSGVYEEITRIVGDEDISSRVIDLLEGLRRSEILERRQKIRSGIQKSEKNMGRPRHEMSDDERMVVLEYLEGGINFSEAVSSLKVGNRTFYRWIDEVKCSGQLA